MRKKHKNSKKLLLKEKKFPQFSLPAETKKYIFGVLSLLAAIIVTFSFFEKAGIAGKIIISSLFFLIGKAVFAVPLILALASLVFFTTRYQKFLAGAILAIFLLVLGISGILGSLNRAGGWLGYLITFPFLKFFGFWVTQIILASLVIIGGLIFWNLLKQPKGASEEKPSFTKIKEEKPSLIKKIFAPRFKVKEVESQPRTSEVSKFPEEKLEFQLKTKGVPQKLPAVVYQLPPLDLLDIEKGGASAGDIRVNAAIIKKTLENFTIPVEMSEINIGPTVTQYTLKPADGIKLSKITTLSNDLSLALASHPIRIEAPIPGKPLVGIEVPNKIRAKVRLRDLLSHPQFQSAPSTLTIALGRDVSGVPIYADLARMPHLLVAGSTGTGKTIFLNSLILSLLYRNSPEILRFILIDPKRVEFTVYRDLPHLLHPVIFDSQRTINALKWLIGEMERRFNVLSENGSRDIMSYNEKVLREELAPLPYLILIIDELADLMVAKGRDMEAGIVRLAQMARAVGIHLVLATQRPSVEVITGLIKANITSRVTFQVASQIDSRTVLDMGGAEKLLGLGDMLFVSAENAKPKRIQGAFVAEKEVKRVVNQIKVQNTKYEAESLAEGIVLENNLAEDMEKTLESPEAGLEDFYGGEDPLYEEAKRVVMEARKASASLLQRRLRVGYARAARLVDMLEQRGVVGPGEGAKPREILIQTAQSTEGMGENEAEENNNNNDWQKV